jgi:hypothetical protein
LVDFFINFPALFRNLNTELAAFRNSSMAALVKNVISGPTESTEIISLTLQYNSISGESVFKKSPLE